MSAWDSLAPTRVNESLKAQIASGDVPHAWLLLGAAGSGKKPAAIAIAAALNCPVEPGIGCGACSTCLRIIRRRFPDVHHIVPEGPIISVDVIREGVIPEAARSTFEGRTKVFVIEEADRMNDSAQNSLLKTLEEPPTGTIFVLMSDQEDELLETVRSRCRVVRLEPVAEARVVEVLKREGADDVTALLAARLSDGELERARDLAFDPGVRARRDLWLGIPRRLTSPVDAMDVAEEVVTEARAAVKAHETLQKAEVTELAEIMGEGRGTASARNALAKRHKRELRRVEEEVLGEALTTIASFYRDVLAARSGGTEAIANLDRMDDIEMWSASPLPDVALLASAERCVQAQSSIPKNANVPLTIEAALLEIQSMAPGPTRVGAS